MSRNYVVNGAFDIPIVDKNDPNVPILSGQALDGVGTYVASRWWVGPGFGGSLNWSLLDFDAETAIDGNPRRYMHLEWTKGPTQGEQPPSNRFTFIENHGCRDGRQLHGCWIDMTWWVRLASGTIAVIPIAWTNCHDGDYQIHSGEAFPVRAERGWHPLTQSIFVPQLPAGKVFDRTSYIGFGLDFLSLYGPTLDVTCASVVRKTTALREPQLEYALANGPWW